MKNNKCFFDKQNIFIFLTALSFIFTLFAGNLTAQRSESKNQLQLKTDNNLKKIITYKLTMDSINIKCDTTRFKIKATLSREGLPPGTYDRRIGGKVITFIVDGKTIASVHADGKGVASYWVENQSTPYPKGEYKIAAIAIMQNKIITNKPAWLRVNEFYTGISIISPSIQTLNCINSGKTCFTVGDTVNFKVFVGKYGKPASGAVEVTIVSGPNYHKSQVLIDNTGHFTTSIPLDLEHLDLVGKLPAPKNFKRWETYRCVVDFKYFGKGCFSPAEKSISFPVCPSNLFYYDYYKDTGQKRCQPNWW